MQIDPAARRRGRVDRSGLRTACTNRIGGNVNHINQTLGLFGGARGGRPARLPIPKVRP